MKIFQALFSFNFVRILSWFSFYALKTDEYLCQYNEKLQKREILLLLFSYFHVKTYLTLCSDFQQNVNMLFISTIATVHTVGQCKVGVSIVDFAWSIFRPRRWIWKQNVSFLILKEFPGIPLTPSLWNDYRSFSS